MMNRLFLSFSVMLLIHFMASAQRVENFRLMDAVSGDFFELESQKGSQAIILIFTSNSCPYSKLYEERIIALFGRFSGEGFTFALVNPHTDLDAEENIDAMKQRAVDRKYGFPYLIDKNQLLTRQLKITKLPEVVVIQPSPTGFAVTYKGAIDNNPQMASNANIRFLENALTNIQSNKNPSPVSSRAVGCNVKLHQ